MAESLKDINAVINVGGVLTHWNGVSSSGGAVQLYDTSPIAGPPTQDFDSNGDVREPITLNITTLVVGADAAARAAFIDKFARATVFDGKEAPSASGDFNVTGEDVVGKRFVVVNRTIGHTRRENSELTIEMAEVGPTPA